LTEKPLKPVINTFWGVSLQESLIATLFGTLMALTKFITRTHLHIPGHTAIFWMLFLVICCLWIKKGRAGTIAGSVAGFLVIILFPGNDGLLNFFKYFFPGIVLDVLFLIFPSLRNRWVWTGIAAMISLSSKVLVDLITGLIAKIPFGVLVWGLRLSFLNHALFGFLSGSISYWLFTRYLKNKIR